MRSGDRRRHDDLEGLGGAVVPRLGPGRVHDAESARCVLPSTIGGDVLRGFAFTLLVGIVSGTYSTVFIAAALSVMLSRRS